MATKTVSISEEAYTRLKKLKKDGESFTDVINRLTGKRPINDFYGILSDETGKELEKAVIERRESAEGARAARTQKLKDAFDDLS